MMSVLGLLCLTVFLVACANNKPLIKEKIIYVNPPQILLIPTETPRFTGSTCGDIISEYIPELKAAIQSCNADKESIKSLDSKGSNIESNKEKK